MTREEMYILQLLRQYAKSPEGKAKIKEKYGIDYKDNVTDKDFLSYGKQMKQILFSYVQPIIKSITLDDIIIGSPTQDANGEWRLTVGFNEERLRRESLYPDGYPDGLRDIVLLFTTGYQARDYVYGEWHGNRTASRLSREPNDFLARAVEQFNAETKGAAKAELLGEYKQE